MSIPDSLDGNLLGRQCEQLEPTQIISGDAVTWQRSISDNDLTPGALLSYVLVNRTATHAISGSQVSAPDGNQFQVDLTSETTSAWTAGWYRWQAYLTDTSGNRRTLAEGKLEVLPNLQAQTSGFDDREPDEKILDAIRELLAGKVLAGDAQSYEIHGRKLQRYTFAELQKLRGQYERRVRAIRIRRGEIKPRRAIGVVFSGW